MSVKWLKVCASTHSLNSAWMMLCEIGSVSIFTDSNVEDSAFLLSLKSVWIASNLDCSGPMYGSAFVEIMLEIPRGVKATSQNAGVPPAD